MRKCSINSKRVADPLLIVIVGPTGSGKSDLALGVAQEFHGEIVNSDSVQLYRYLDIGTAKTPEPERRGIPHHLIDILDPDEHFTAGDYSRLARQIIQAIAARGRTPIVAGGTGFYVRALLKGLFEGPPRDVELRERLARRQGDSLHRLLGRFDPAAAARIHPNDKQKLIRALEVCLLARRPLTELFTERPTRPLTGFRVVQVGLNPPRGELAARINARCVRMFERGLLSEIRQILEMGFSADAKALSSIGYREGILHIQGKLSLDEAIFRTQCATRQYAKRQWTWFRSEPDICWVDGFGWEEKVLRGVVHHLNVGISCI